MLNTFLLYFNTIRYLKFRQIYWRLIYVFYEPKIKNGAYENLAECNPYMVVPLSKRKCYIGSGNFMFLSKTLNIKNTGWQSKSCEKLWIYNLNYFDFLLQELTEVEQQEVLNILNDWIQENKLGSGIPWDPYPTSLRIVNLVKWILLGNNLQKEVIHSLIQQTRYLNKKIEWHLDGNHLLANAKALIFAGICFRGLEAKKWLTKGCSILLSELEKQVLDDGGHFELSPMYQSILIEDLIDILNLFRSNLEESSELIDLEKYIKIMLQWLLHLTHPDGKIAHFNDASMDAIKPTRKLVDYAKNSGVYLEENDLAQCNLESSGFVKSVLGESYLIIDGGDIYSSHQPGHVHAGTASFELSVFGKRVFVNTGISTYELGSKRTKERGTSSHNTLEINGENSSQVWASFRVARRAKVIKKNLYFQSDRSVFSIAHNGYRYLNGKPVHQRYFQHDVDQLELVDEIHGSFDKACGRLHIHPEISICNIHDDEVTLQITENQFLKLYFSHCELKICDYLFCLDFGRMKQSKCIEYQLTNNSSKIVMQWLQS